MPQPPMQHIIQHLFNTTSLSSVPREQLEELVEQYPSFGVARYLLSRKLKAEDADSFTAETLKTNLYFNNPYWLQWLLQSSDETSGTVTAVTTVPAEAAAISDADPSVSSPDEGTEEVQQEIDEEPAVEMQPVETEVTPEPVVEAEAEAEAQPDPELVAAALTNIQTESGHAEGPSAADQLLESIAALRLTHQQLDHTPQVEEIAPAAEEDAGGHSLVATALEQAEEPAVEGPAMPPFEEPVTEPPVAQTVKLSPQATVKEPLIPIEPYHTIDYFASLGIKLTLDENPTDKLGKQLKSFTDWLKVMRKLPQKNQQPVVPDLAAEHLVRASAANSIQGKEIVTETMAEVLVKQGMRERAVEVYKKLSLLDPQKSAYFASKIEQLKID